MLTVTQVLDVLLDAIPVEAATVMQTPDGVSPPIHQEFATLLPMGIEIKQLERYAFYDAVSSPQTALIIATGESRRFANLLLTVGVVRKD
jgi:L-fucose mutarotase